MIKGIIAIKFAIIGLAVILFLISKRYISSKEITFPENSITLDTVEKSIKESESKIDNLVPNASKRIVWAKEKNKQTEYSLIYIHGYTGNRKEIAPIPEEVAKEMGMNLFETRFKGSGISERRKAFKGITIEDHLKDAYEALSIGKILGKKIVIMATSNGANYSFWLANKFPKSIAALVLFSPNIFPIDWRTNLVLWPFGKQLAYLFTGGYISTAMITRQKGEKNTSLTKEAKERVKQNSVHVDSLITMMEIIRQVRKFDYGQFKAPLLIFYSEGDSIVSVPAIKKFFDNYGIVANTSKKIVQVTGSTGTEHGLVGHGFGEHTIKPSVEIVSDYLRNHLKGQTSPQKQEIIRQTLDLSRKS